MSFFSSKTTEESTESQDVNTMTITRALVELKTLDKRIQKLITESVFVSTRGEMRKPDQRATKAQSNYDRIRDLLERRVKLKSAIVSSNANTRVRVAGLDLTVAEAIELKSSISNYSKLLSRLRQQYGDATRLVETENARTRNLLENSFTKGNSNNDTDRTQVNLEEYSRQYMKMHGLDLFDPINCQQKVEDLDNFITEFESQVDFVLSEKNATTTLTL